MTAATFDFCRETADIDTPDDDFRAVKYFDLQTETEQLLIVTIPVAEGSPNDAFDLDQVNQQLERYASLQGVDLSALSRKAGERFGKSRIVPRNSPLSDEEIQLLIEDDQRALDD